MIMARLGANRYGTADDGTDVIRDWNMSTSLSGDLAD